VADNLHVRPPVLWCAAQAAAEHDRHTSAVSGLVQNVEEGLAQITAAGAEAGLAAGHTDEAAQDVDMVGDSAGQVRVTVMKGCRRRFMASKMAQHKVQDMGMEGLGP
jgi:hypothetical protein